MNIYIPLSFRVGLQVSMFKIISSSNNPISCPTRMIRHLFSLHSIQNRVLGLFPLVEPLIYRVSYNA